MNIPKIRLSNNFANGSPAKRVNLAENFNSRLFHELLPMYKNTNFVSIRKIEYTLKKLLPEPVYLTVRKLTPDEMKKYTGAMITYFSKNKVTNYKICMLSINNRMPIQEMPTLMHECMHLFDSLLNPKYIKTKEKLRERKLNDLERSIYSNYFLTNKGYADYYTNKKLLKITKNETKNVIKDLPPEDKILILNHIREALQSEINAYRETQKYAVELSKNKKRYKYIDYDGYHKSYMLDEKLNIVNSMLYKIIRQERSKNARDILIRNIKSLLSSQF